MKFADEFRDADLANALAARITAESGDKHWKIMEVCGGHTHTIFKYGIEDLRNQRFGNWIRLKSAQ